MTEPPRAPRAVVGLLASLAAGAAFAQAPPPAPEGPLAGSVERGVVLDLTLVGVGQAVLGGRDETAETHDETFDRLTLDAAKLGW